MISEEIYRREEIELYIKEILCKDDLDDSVFLYNLTEIEDFLLRFMNYLLDGES